MSRELLVLRHAKSDWQTKAARDFDRPLAKRGKRDAPAIGAWLYREGLVPDYVLSSPAERAKQTALKVCKSLELGKKQIHWEPKIYAADLDNLLRLLQRCPDSAETVLIIGHNPGLEDLVAYLAGDDAEVPKDGKLLPTAAVARLEMPDSWNGLQRSCASLMSITRPRNLP